MPSLHPLHPKNLCFGIGHTFLTARNLIAPLKTNLIQEGVGAIVRKL